MMLNLVFRVMTELKEAVGAEEAKNIIRGVSYIAEETDRNILRIFQFPGVLENFDYDGEILKSKDGTWSSELWDGERIFLWLESLLYCSPLSGEYDEIALRGIENFKRGVLNCICKRRNFAKAVLKDFESANLAVVNGLPGGSAPRALSLEEKIFFSRFEEQIGGQGGCLWR